MALSANFTVGGTANPRADGVAHAAAYGATVNLAILSITGIDAIEWAIISSSKSGTTLPTVTPSGTPTGSTASFVMPSNPGDGLGRAFIVKCHVRGAAGTVDSYAIVGAANSSGIIPICAGEENYRDATYGYTNVINQALSGLTPGSPGSQDLVSVLTIGANAGGIEITGGAAATGNTGLTTLGQLLGYIARIEISASLVGSVNNWAPASFNGSDVIRVSASSAFDVTGIVPPTTGPRIKLLANVGANTITLKHQNASSTTSNWILLSTGADYALVANSAVWLYFDSTSSRCRITPAGAGGGGGGENLQATLALGNSAGGLDINAVGVLSSQGELVIRQSAAEILATTSGSTILTASDAAGTIGLRAGTIQHVSIFDQAGVRTILAGSADRDTFVITSLAKSNSDARNITILPSAPLGTSKNGGIVTISGTAPTVGGAAGGFNFARSTDGVALVSFRDTLVTYGIPISVTGAITGSGLGTFGSLSVGGSGLLTGSLEVQTFLAVRGGGSGSAIAATGDGRFRSGGVLSWRNPANSADLAGLQIDGSGVIIVGNTSSSTATIRAASSITLAPGGTTRLSVQAGGVLVHAASLAFAQSVTGGVFVGCEAAISGDGQAVAVSGQSAPVTGNQAGGPLHLLGGKRVGTGLQGAVRIGWTKDDNSIETMIEAVTIGASRRVIALGLGVALTTQVPSGDKVVWFAPAGTAPVSAPTSGNVQWADPSTGVPKIWVAGEGAAKSITYA